DSNSFIAGDWLLRSASTLCVGGFVGAHTRLFDISHLRLVRTHPQGPQGVGCHPDDVTSVRSLIGTVNHSGIRLGATGRCGDWMGPRPIFRRSAGTSELGGKHTGGRYAVV